MKTQVIFSQASWCDPLQKQLQVVHLVHIDLVAVHIWIPVHISVSQKILLVGAHHYPPLQNRDQHLLH